MRSTQRMDRDHKIALGILGGATFIIVWHFFVGGIDWLVT